MTSCRCWSYLQSIKIPIGNWTNKGSLDLCGEKLREALVSDMEGACPSLTRSVA